MCIRDSITDERFDRLLADYEAEQKALQTAVAEAEEKLSAFAEDTARVEQFLDKHPMKCVRGRLFTVDEMCIRDSAAAASVSDNPPVQSAPSSALLAAPFPELRPPE